MKEGAFRLYLVFITLAVVLVLVYLITFVVPLVPLNESRLASALILAIALYIALRTIIYLFDRWFRSIDPHSRATFKYLISLVWYGIMGIAIAAALGLDVSSVILGSAFASIVLGLASQTVLSNMVAGIAILTTWPIKVGERITIATWQFGNVFPTYPPKFFSQDLLINGYTGTITSVKFMYTSLMDDEGGEVIVPNSIVIQSLTRKYSGEIYTTVRYQIANGTPVQEALKRIGEAVGRCGDVTEHQVLIDESTTTGYVIKVIAKCKGNRQDLCRSNILNAILMEFSGGPPDDRRQQGPS